MKRRTIVWLGVCVVGLTAWLHANPLRTVHPAVATVQASRIALMADAGELHLLWQEHDNTTGLAVRVYEDVGFHAVVVDPLSPHPAHAGHMTEPLVPASGVLRHESLLQLHEYPLQRVGARWVAALPDGPAGLLPGDRIELLVWDAGADPEVDDEAGFRGFLELL